MTGAAAAGAELHRVYFGTDYEQVRSATPSTAGIYRGTQTSTSFDPGDLGADQVHQEARAEGQGRGEVDEPVDPPGLTTLGRLARQNEAVAR